MDEASHTNAVAKLMLVIDDIVELGGERRRRRGVPKEYAIQREWESYILMDSTPQH